MYRILVQNPQMKEPMEILGLGVRILVELILNKKVAGILTDSSGSGYMCCERGNKPSGSIKREGIYGLAERLSSQEGPSIN